MSQKKELIKNTFIISIGKFSTKLVNFLLLPLYTSILLTEETGQVDVLNRISIFLIPFITLQMDEGMFRFLIDAKNNQDKENVFSNTVKFMIISSILWSILIFFVGNYIVHYEYTNWLVLYCIASVVYTLASSFARGESNYKLYSLLAFLDSFIRILLNILFIAVLNFRVKGMFLAYIISAIVTGIFGLIVLKAHKYINLKKMETNVKLKEMIKYSFPLVPTTISWSLVSLTDTLLIVARISDSANGIYSTSNQFPLIVNTCYSFFNTSWRESASRMVDKEEKNEFYNSVFLTLKRFLFAVSIMLVAVLPFMFNILVNESYNESYIYIPFMLLSVYFTNLASFTSGIFSAYKDTKILAPTTMFAALVSITFNIVLIDKIGLYAPVIGTLIGYAIIYYYRKFKLKKYINLAYDKFTISNIIIYMALIHLAYYSNNNLAYIFGIIVATGYSIYTNYDLIKEILNSKKIKKLLRRK